MSANIKWRTLGEGKNLESILTPSAFIGALGLPSAFSSDDYPFLRGLKAGRPDWADAIEEIMRAIAEFGSIEVFAVY